MGDRLVWTGLGGADNQVHDIVWNRARPQLLKVFTQDDSGETVVEIDTLQASTAPWWNVEIATKLLHAHIEIGKPLESVES